MRMNRLDVQLAMQCFLHFASKNIVTVDESSRPASFLLGLKQIKYLEVLFTFIFGSAQ